MEEEKIVVLTDENSDEIDIVDIEQDISNEETVEYIEVDEPEEIVVEISEELISPGVTDEVLTHNDLSNRNISDQHTIGAITGLEGILEEIQSLKSGLYASSGGLAEFRKWANKDLIWESHLGCFVSIVDNGDIDICNKQINDVYGVVVGPRNYIDENGTIATMSGSAFCGYQHKDNMLNNPNYAVVCLVGEVKVRVHKNSKIKAGDYVVADNCGYAIKSENNVGFRVLSIGTDPILEHYASIALVPQNDNVSRVMEELSATNGQLGDIIIQLGKVEDSLTGIEKDSNTAIDVAEDAKGLVDILNEAVGSMGTQLDNVTDIANQAKDSAERAIADASVIYTEAAVTAQKAKESAESALGDLAKLQENIEPLANWSDGELFGISGFIKQANSEHTLIGTLTTAMYGDNVGTIGVIQEIDRNKTVLKHIVADADKYSVGPYSLSYKLTRQEADGILKTEHIYVATQTHTETSDLYICSVHPEVDENTLCYFTVGDIKYSFIAPKRIYSNDIIQCNIASRELFAYDEIYSVNIVQDITDMTELQFISEYTYSFESGKSYMWREDIDNPGVYIWAYHSDVYFNPPESPQEGDLWFCLNGVTDTDGSKLIYYPETLYHLDGAQWVSVATIDGNLQARTIGLMKQKSNELTSTYTNLRGDVSTMSQTVDKISTVVLNVDGKGSTLEQAADEIIAGTFSPEKSSSLSLLLDYGFKAVSEGRYHKRMNSFAGTTTVVGNRYTQPPSWSESDGKFIFNDAYVDYEGKYYFNSDDQTTYCKDVNGGYETYTIGNTAISALDSRVSDTESEMNSWTRFKTGTNETMSTISQSSSEDAADIASVVYGNYRQCVEIKTELTDEEKSIIPTDRYNKAPNYVDKAFVFNDEPTTDGKYYMLDGDNAHYYKVINSDDAIIGYEKYTMKTSNYASIMQKVDENGSVIGLVANNNDVEGGIFVTAINNSTTALINADKIGINGTAIFKDSDKEGYTVISGNYIGTGILQSNNYLAPSEGNTFAQAGTSFNLNDGTINSKNFDLNANGDVSITGKITATSGYIGDGENGFTIGNTFLYNGQTSLVPGSGQGTAGVYIAPNGIGLGNGNFYIDANGNVTMSGDINMSNGVITWSASNSPVLVLYARTKLGPPTEKYDAYDTMSAVAWHQGYDDIYDYYASYSYDGGNTWTNVVKIRGEDGNSASVTYANVKKALNQATNAAFTIVTENSVETPNIYGGNIYGGNIYAGNGDGWYSQMCGTGLNIFNANGVRKFEIGYTEAEESNSPEYPYMLIGAGDNTSDSSGMILKFKKSLWIGNNAPQYLGGDYPGGYVDEKVSNGVGILFDFENLKIYKYENGEPSEIGSGSGGTVTAVFG